MDDDKLTELAKEVARLDGEVKRLSSNDGKRERELIALRETLEKHNEPGLK